MSNKKKNNIHILLISLVIIAILILIPMYLFNIGPFKHRNSSVTTKEGPTAKIHFLNTGSSDCFLIESNGHFGLVDSSNPPFNDGTSRAIVKNNQYTVTHVVEYLDKIGVNKLDFIIATHSHSDHLGGMQIIAQKYVDNNTKYYYRTYVETSDDTVHPDWDNMGYYTRAIDAMNEKSAELIEVTNKEPSFEIGEFTIKLFNTEPASDSEKNEMGIARGENKNSIITLVTFEDKKVLITADLEFEDEDKIAEEIGKIDILKMGHHGYPTSSKISFLDTLKPNEIIISNEEFHISNGAVSALRHIEKTNNTKVYLTGKVKDAIVVSFKDNTYTLLDENGKNPHQLELIIEQNENWERINYNTESTWIYYNNGDLVNGWQQLTKNGIESWYYFTRIGIVTIGWKELNRDGIKSWYYFDSDGSMARGWRRIKYQNEMKWYYFQFDGRKAQNTCLTIENEKHCFDDNGICFSGKNC